MHVKCSELEYCTPKSVLSISWSDEIVSWVVGVSPETDRATGTHVNGTHVRTRQGTDQIEYDNVYLRTIGRDDEVKLGLDRGGTSEWKKNQCVMVNRGE